MQNLIDGILLEINNVVLGKTTEVKLSLACLLAKGHLLIEDLPGMGKTTLAHALAQTLGLSFQRIQFTSDLLPADVIGISIYQQGSNEFTLHQGPIFTQVLLADEINRASPKTQSALLEAMEEHQVSIDGTSYPLPEPFFVIATQNPLHHAGTYPLPESQLDRFMMRIRLGFPSAEAEKRILQGQEGIRSQVKSVAKVDHQQLTQLQTRVNHVHASDAILDYVIALARFTRSNKFSGNPLSPRAGKALLQAAKAWAMLDSRDFILPEDVQAVFPSVCEHRLALTHYESSSEHHSIAEHILSSVDPLSV